MNGKYGDYFLNNITCNLGQKKCKPCEGGVLPLSKTECDKLLASINGWQLNEACDTISRSFEFSNYYETMAFVNALAWMAHKEGHHPDLHVSFNKCLVSYSTHAIKGLSENDFICAAKTSKIFE